MQRVSFIAVLILGCLISSNAWTADKPVQLVLEQDNTLTVGQEAVMHIPSDNKYYWVSGKNAAWHRELDLVHRSKRNFTFRAIHPGRVVIILSATGPGGGISCATHHVFIDVVPNR